MMGSTNSTCHEVAAALSLETKTILLGIVFICHDINGWCTESGIRLISDDFMSGKMCRLEASKTKH